MRQLSQPYYAHIVSSSLTWGGEQNGLAYGCREVIVDTVSNKMKPGESRRGNTIWHHQHKVRWEAQFLPGWEELPFNDSLCHLSHSYPPQWGYGSLFKTDSWLQPSSVGAPAMYHESLGKTQAPHSNMPLPCKLTACYLFHLANAFGSGPAIFWDILPPHIYMATHKLWLPWDLSPLLTGSRVGCWPRSGQSQCLSWLTSALLQDQKWALGQDE